MSDTPLMPMATAVWLVENTTLTFKQIANFCKLHELEVKGIADGDVAKGIKAYNPILAGQLTREEIETCSQDPSKPLSLNKKILDINVEKERISLGIKHLNSDPVQEYIEKNPISSKVTGKITEIDEKTCKVTISAEEEEAKAFERELLSEINQSLS